MTDLVSILIPAYNAERWIGDTLESASGQTWSRKEVIVVDDGSTDSTYSIASQFASADVRIVRQQNAGASAARNHALRLARGNYIQWLDSDDVLAPDKISEQMARVRKLADPLIMMSGAFGEFYYDIHRARITPTELWQDLTPIDYFLHKFSGNVWLNPSAWLVSRELTEMAGPWDERLSLDDDGEYFCRVVSHSSSIVHVPSAKSFYRRGIQGSLSRSASRSACQSLILSLRLNTDRLLSMEDSERTRQACLNYLQTWVEEDYFRAQQRDLFEQVQGLASEFGGSVRVPKSRGKYRAFRMLFGEAGEVRARRFLRSLRLMARAERERLTMKIGSNSS
jgi:glycosyltransferase involved in cell wall biosynthesis